MFYLVLSLSEYNIYDKEIYILPFKGYNMKTFVVTMEFNVQSVDLADIKVLANSEEEAREIALKMYMDGKTGDLDFYASDDYDSSISSETSRNWRVEEDQND